MKGIRKQGRRRIGSDLFWGLLLLSLLAGTILSGGCQPAEKPAVEISEVVSSNGQSYVREGYGALDWIELHNAGTRPVSLNGWFLTDKYASLDADCALPPITLPPDGYCVLFADKEMADAGSLRLPFGLSKSGETLYLFSSDGAPVAELRVPALEKDVSWARRLDGTYGYCLIPTPENPNDGEILDQLPMADSDDPLLEETFRGDGPLEITEVVSSNGLSLLEKPYGAVDWIELHNRSREPLSLRGWYLSDRASLVDGSCALPDVTVPPDGYFVILADTEGAKIGDRCLPFSIRKTGETLYLYDPTGQRAGILVVPALEKDVSWTLDSSGAYGYCLYPTPGAANTAEIVAELTQVPAAETRVPGRQSAISLRINEVCSAPAPGETDWIELYNPTDEPVSVEGFYLTDSTTNITKATLPALTVPGRGYLMVPLGPAVAPTEGIAAFSLSSAGEALYLFDDELGLVDMAEVPALREGLVYARREDGTFGYCGVPTPGAANGSGIYETSRRTMAADSPIHINEGLYRNRYSVIDAYGDRSDWVELVNRSKTACSLSGYFLSDDENDLTKWPLPDRTLKPGEYLLVFLSGHESTGTEVHAPFSISKKNAGCYLYRAAELAVELLPYPQDLPENVSLGLDEAGQLIYFAYPTPGYANARSFSGPLPASIFPAGAILISEVSAGGDDGDWVELYNRSDGAVKLNGWHLSDDADELTKKSLDGLSLKPGGYALVHLTTKGGEALFSIARAGEELVLSDDKGAVRDVFASGALQKGHTSGRVEQSPEAGRVFFESPTPGKRNSTHLVQGYAGKPRFSDTALYHDSPFTLTLEAGDGTVIHYTLDGSAPTADSPVYREPLTIGKNTTVRAVGMGSDRFASEEAVATYLFRAPHTLPVVCLAAAPDRWTQLTKAPRVTAGLEEQLSYITYYEADGTLGTTFPAGISPRGNASLGYPQKSLSVHLRGAYGQSAVTYPFWGEKSFLSYKFLVLRNGSQDIRAARLRDSFASRAAENLHVMTVWTRPVIVYVNGTYYGIMDLNEGMNQDYLWTHYGLDQDTVNMVQRNDSAKRGSAAEFVALRQFASRRNMADDQVYAEFLQRMDVDAFNDYLIAQSFFGNYDIHNQNWWGTTDGKLLWQPILYDIDRCLNETSLNSNVLGMYFNSSGVVHNLKGDRILMEIPCGLKKNAAWRQRFVERYAQVLCTDFSEERLLGLLDSMADELRPEMAEHAARWQMPDSLSSWEKSIQLMRQCISRRYAKITGQIKSQFSLSASEWDALMEKYSGH